MKRTNSRLTGAGLMSVAVVALAAVGLAGCGGSGSSSSTAGAATTAPASKETSTAAASASSGGQASSSEAAGSGAGGLTPPGAQLKLGQTATVGWVPPGSFEPTKTQSGVELKVAVEAIEEGSKSDLSGVELESNEKGAVPFYVHLRLEAPSGQAVPAEEDPAYSFTAIDDRDQEQASVTFIGGFAPCEETPAPHPFDDGASYETCLTYLMKGGGSIQKVEWNSGPAKANQVTAYFEAPIVWAAG